MSELCPDEAGHKQFKFLTVDDYLMGRDRQYGITATQLLAARELVDTLNALMTKCAIQLVITSGYRPPALNMLIPGSKPGDAHESCRGVDLRDSGKALSKWLVENVETMVILNLWMESPTDAADHVHLQSYPPKSGNRIFKA
jgi:hypothetical protein